MGRAIRIVFLTLAALMVIASPAQASIVKHGDDISNVAYNNNRLIACDEEIDGNRFYSQGVRYDGTYDKVVDTRGKDDYCPSINPPGTFKKHRGCEPGNGCTKWEYH